MAARVSQFDDLRYLATIDTHHKMLSRATDAALGRYTINIQRRQGQPVVAIAMREGVCPIDPKADYQIAFWVIDIRLDTVIPELARSVTDIRQAMVRAGKRGLWGFVPNEGADHLKAFLDPLADAGLVARIAGESEFSRITFYIGDRDVLADHILGDRP